MSRQQGERPVEQLHVTILMDPATRTARMRQRNHDACPAFMLHRMLPSDDIAQWLDADKTLNRQPSERVVVIGWRANCVSFARG